MSLAMPSGAVVGAAASGQPPWAAEYTALMTRAVAILDDLDAIHARGCAAGDHPIDEAERLIAQAKALRAQAVTGG